MINRTTLIGCLLLTVLSASKPNYLIADAKDRDEIKRAYIAKQKRMPNSPQLNIPSKGLTAEEKEALMFLYAYMPIGDVLDYSQEFYIKEVKTTLQAKKEMPWGKDIPENIFRHFVLPVRVNNEALDSARSVIYNEIKDRVKNLSLRDAVLEVNHWCHEKVVYTPTDARTSAPLATIKTAYGRCGEESTLTVAALRAVGIPARQVYTPRWAHTNDNHAWVEAWVDGKWYFFGACEPEPVLNLGWFNGPAYRSLLMHTRAFGSYHGPEPTISANACFTEINVTDSYAPTATAIITVTTTDGKPVKDAEVRYTIYNYAEFYTVTKQKTNDKGQSSFLAGKGDMVVWAYKDGKWGYCKVSFGKDSDYTIKLDKKVGENFSDEINIVPPVDGAITAVVTEEQKKANALRLQIENSIRERYISTFISKDSLAKIANQLSINKDTLQRYISLSRGNWQTILTFLQKTPATKHSLALTLLSVISEKDLRDISLDVLQDHLNNTPANNLGAEFADFTINPRVASELLSPYKSVIRREISPKLAGSIKKDPRVLIEWINKNIASADDYNPQQIPATVLGVWKGKIADKLSRDIFFVGVCRSLGVPARIEAVTGKTQYYHNKQWVDVSFENTGHKQPQKGSLVASYNAISTNNDPQYYSHYTLAKFDNGDFNTLDFRFRGGADMEVGTAWSDLLKSPLSLDEGYYMLVSGNRMANGSVLAAIKGFNVVKDSLTKTELLMRQDNNEVEVIGSIDAECKFNAIGKDTKQSILETTGRGYFVVMIAGAKQEPTNHAFRALARIKNELEGWNRQIVVLFNGEQQWKDFNVNEFPGLPSTITYGIDSERAVGNMIAKAMKLTDTDRLPIIIVADTFGRVVYLSQGYNTTLNDQLIGIIKKL